MLSLQGNTDLAEVPDSFVHNGYMDPSFDVNTFAFATVDQSVMVPADRWAQLLVGKQFRYKNEELEDDLIFKRKHPTNVFAIYSIVTYSADKMQFLPANLRYSKRNLHFLCYSMDAVDDYELIPIKSFHAALQERERFYQTLPLEAEFAQNFNFNTNEVHEDNSDQSVDFMQGVPDHLQVFKLTPLQIGIFATLLPPAKGYVANQGSLYKLRRSLGLVIKKLISDELSEEDKSGWINILIALPYMSLQYDKSKPDEHRCNGFYSLLLSGDAGSSYIYASVGIIY